ncbi:hypothetical protein ACOMHN_066378 [Nucella lapillus]
MVVNIFPHGFTDLASWNIKYPETADTSCALKPVERAAAFSNRGWRGFVGEFLHEKDSCAGDATLESETGRRHPTDSNVTVTCSVPKPTTPPPLPVPRLSVTVKELKGIQPGPQVAKGRRVRTDVEINFALNIPNRVGQLVYDGKETGTEKLILQVYKHPQDPLGVHFKCVVRLCDSRVDYFCYECHCQSLNEAGWL